MLTPFFNSFNMYAPKFKTFLYCPINSNTEVMMLYKLFMYLNPTIEVGPYLTAIINDQFNIEDLQLIAFTLSWKSLLPCKHLSNNTIINLTHKKELDFVGYYTPYGSGNITFMEIDELFQILLKYKQNI